MMESQDHKRAPTWTEREVWDLLAIWGDESVLAELRSSKRNGKILEKVSKAMKDRGHNRDARQCRVKIKELRQAYHKARDANRRSGAEPQTCRFYAELHAVLEGAATTTPTVCFDSFNGETHSEAGSVYEEDEDEDNVDSSQQQGRGETSFPNSQDMFITLDLEPVTPELTQGVLPDSEVTQGTSANLGQNAAWGTVHGEFKKCSSFGSEDGLVEQLMSLVSDLPGYSFSPWVLESYMAADGNALVPLRQKTKQKSQGIFIMSRRRISCKDLGLVDYQAWLYKKKEKGPFIGNKWKKFWFVLKGSSLYWYSSQLAEKAEGFINLPDFTVDRASECKKKYAIKVSHPQIKTFYFAAENVEEMNRWLNKLGLAVIPQASNGKNEEECYSESEHEDPEIAGETPPPPYTEQPPPPHLAQQQSLLISPLSSEASCSLSSLESTMKSQDSSSSLLAKMAHSERQSWLHIVNTEEVDQPLSFCVQIHADDHPMADSSEMAESRLLKSNNGSQNSLLSEDTTSSDSSRDRLTVPEDLIGTKTLSKEQAKCSEDEMERLYKSLEQASLSPIGDRRPSTKKELRKSFAKRSKNPSMNEKLHQIRMLNSTLKCKEHDLAMINQLLEDPELTARKYREWKNTNTMLIQEIYQQQDALAVPGGNSKEP